MFSQKELDKATAMLLPQIQTLAGKVLDFGCGSGVIGASLKKRFPNIKIHLVDISALALFSATQTLAANGLSGEVFATDGYSQINTCFDHIISNPPFHVGLKTHYSTTEELLSQAPNYLNPNGQLTIVANFLKYPPFIEQAFGHCHRLIKDNHFTVYYTEINIEPTDLSALPSSKALNLRQQSDFNLLKLANQIEVRIRL